MARQFEDIEVWQLARSLVKEIYLLTSQEKIRSNFALADQLRRAALSIMNNIAEGFDRFSSKEFLYLLNIAKGSVGEVRSMLYVLLDLKLLEDSQFSALQQRTITISRSLTGFITYLRRYGAIKKPKPQQEPQKESE
jgi:four helix bundle protein